MDVYIAAEVGVRKGFANPSPHRGQEADELFYVLFVGDCL